MRNERRKKETNTKTKTKRISTWKTDGKKKKKKKITTTTTTNNELEVKKLKYNPLVA